MIRGCAVLALRRSRAPRINARIYDARMAAALTTAVQSCLAGLHSSTTAAERLVLDFERSCGVGV